MYDDCRILPQPFVLKISGYAAPVVFTTSAMGYMVSIENIPSIYQSQSLKYFNMRSSGGLTAYITKETVGVGMFVENSFYVLTSRSTYDFFNTEIDDELQRSIVSFTPVSKDLMLISAVVNLSGGTKLMYVSKLFEIDSIVVSMSSKVQPTGMLSKYIDDYSIAFDDDGRPTGLDGEFGRSLSENEYNGSTGFGDVSNEIFDVDDPEIGLIDINRRVADDIENYSNIDTISGDILAIQGFFNGEKVTTISIQKSKITINTDDGDVSEKDEFDFDSDIDDSRRKNVLQNSFLEFKLLYEEADIIYSEYGIFASRCPCSEILFSAPITIQTDSDSDNEESSESSVSIGYFKLEYGKVNKEYSLNTSSEDSKIYFNYKYSISSDLVDYIFHYGRSAGFNTNGVEDTDVVSYIGETKFYSSVQYSGQDEEIYVTGSMSEIVPYKLWKVEEDDTEEESSET